MSVKEVTAKAIICDECEKPQEEHPEARAVMVLGAKCALFVTVSYPAVNDVCDRCQVKALGIAARQVGAIKPRGRAAQKAKAEGQPSEGAPGDPTAPPSPPPNPIETPATPEVLGKATPPKVRRGRKPKRKEYVASPVTPPASFQPGDLAMPLDEGMAPGPYRVEGTGDDAGRPYVTVLLPDGTLTTFFMALLRHATTDEKKKPKL